MKTFSLQLADNIFQETELIIKGLKITRNKYINEAVDLFNRLNKRKLLKEQLIKESAIVSKSNMDILAAFEKSADIDYTV